MPNPQNIEKHKWAKGESGNLSGMPKGILHSKTIIRKWLETKEKAKNPLTGKGQELTQLDIMVLKQLEKGRKGDTIAFRELLDRMEGKAKQELEMTGDGVTTIRIIRDKEL